MKEVPIVYMEVRLAVRGMFLVVIIVDTLQGVQYP
jgi:hypothetical protein